MKKFIDGLITGIVVGILIFCGICYWLVSDIQPNLIGLPSFPKYQNSTTFDCDDATLAMVKICEQNGWDYIIIAGNLQMENETFSECNHFWIWVNFGGVDIPYDWGYPAIDEQHYYGYDVGMEGLLHAVAADK